MNLGDVFLRVRPDLQGFWADVKKEAGGSDEGAGKTLGERLGAGVKQHATKIAAGAGALVGTFVAGAVQEFGKFENSMNEVFTLLPGITDAAMKDMTGQVKDFANEFGVLPEEVVPALYQSLSAGVPRDNVFAFLEQANKSAKAGAASTAEAVALLATVTKGYGDTSEEAVKRTADLAQGTVRLGTTTMPELAASIGKVIPQAAALGVAEEELWAITAALTGVTGNTAEVMTQQKAIMTSLLNPTAEMKRGLAEMGFESGQAAVEALGLQGMLAGLQATTAGNTETFAKMLGSSEALTAGLAIVGARADQIGSNMEELAGNTGEVDLAFERMESGITAQANRIAARIKTLALDIGEEFQALGPLFIAFGPTMGRWLGAGLGAIGGLLAKGLIKAWGSVMTPALGLAIGVAGKVAGSIYAAAITGGGNVVSLVQRGWARLGMLAGGRFGPAFKLAAGAAIALLWVEVWDQWNAFMEKVEQAQKRLREKVAAIEAYTAEQALAALERTTTLMRGMQGIQRILADTAGGAEMVEGLRNMGTALLRETNLTADQIERGVTLLWDAAEEAAARGNQAIASELTAMAFELKRRAVPEVIAATGETAEAATVLGGGMVRLASVVRGQVSRIGAAFAALPGMIEPPVASTGERLAAAGPRFRDAIRSARDQVKQAMDDLRWEIAHPMKWKKTVDLIESKIRTLGRKSEAAAEEGNQRLAGSYSRAQLRVIAIWEEMTNQAWDWSKSWNENLARGQRQTRDKPVDEAGTTNRQVKGKLRDKSGLTEGGRSLVDAWSAGIQAGLLVAKLRLLGSSYLAAIKSIFGGSLPETGPLVGAWEGGGDLAAAWGDRLLQGLGVVRRDLDPMMSEMAATLGLTAPGSLAVAVDGRLVSAGPTVFRHEHTITAEGARNLRAEGFDDAAVARLLRSAAMQADTGWKTR